MDQLDHIKDKLDELLELKSKGMGAVSLIGLLLGSGVLGIIGVIFTIFNSRPHL